MSIGTSNCSFGSLRELGVLEGVRFTGQNGRRIHMGHLDESLFGWLMHVQSVREEVRGRVENVGLSKSSR